MSKSIYVVVRSIHGTEDCCECERILGLCDSVEDAMKVVSEEEKKLLKTLLIMKKMYIHLLRLINIH
jgi:hypothetical protein